MHLGKKRATGFVEDDMEAAAVADADLAVDPAAADRSGPVPAGPELEHATAG